MNLEPKQKPDAYDFVHQRSCRKTLKTPMTMNSYGTRKILYISYFKFIKLIIYIIHYSLRINIVCIKYYNLTNSYNICV